MGLPVSLVDCNREITNTEGSRFVTTFHIDFNRIQIPGDIQDQYAYVHRLAGVFFNALNTTTWGILQ